MRARSWLGLPPRRQIACSERRTFCQNLLKSVQKRCVVGSQRQWPSPSPQVNRWTTEDVPPHLRLDYWAGAICEVYLRAACSSSPTVDFDGLIESVPCAGINFTRMQSSRIAMRTLASEPDGCKDVVYAVAHANVNWTLTQRGQVQQLRAGDVALIDAREPYQVLFHEGMSICALELPIPWLSGHLRRFASFGSHVVSRDAGWGRVLSSLCLELSRDLNMVLQVPGTSLADQLGALLAASVEPAQAEHGRLTRSLREQAEDMLLQRLAEPGLTAADVAQALNVSLRTLHRAFQAAGTTYAASLRKLRLEQASALLKRKALSELPVAEVGARCGFQDASHFSREFHRSWGMPPAKWRRVHGGRDQRAIADDEP